jgi:hypothetical protein
MRTGGRSTHSFTEYCNGFTDFAQSGFDSVIVGRHSKRPSLFLSLELVEDELVLYASILAVIGEVVKREFGHYGNNRGSWRVVVALNLDGITTCR